MPRFFAKKIPVFFFFTGIYKQLHQPKDKVESDQLPRHETRDRHSREGHRRLGQAIRTVTKSVHKGKAVRRPGTNGAPRLAFTPDYSHDGKGGVKVASVAKEGPGDTAGLKAGDRHRRICRPSGQESQRLHQGQDSQKAGEPVEVVVRRNDKNVTLKATLQ